MILRLYWHNSLYGCNDFVDYDGTRGWRGNTASTSRALNAYDVAVEVKRKKELGEFVRALELNGVKVERV